MINKLEIFGLTKRFGEKTLFEDLDLTLAEPAVLWAPSGWGKTTLLRILMGLEVPDSGTVQGVGRVGAVFQEDRLCPQLTAAANLTLTGHGLTLRDAERELRTLGFTDAELALPAARLSGGQKRLVSIACILAMEPEVILLDEPTTALDPASVDRLTKTIESLQIAKLIVSHDFAFLKRVCGRKVTIRDAQILALE